MRKAILAVIMFLFAVSITAGAGAEIKANPTPKPDTSNEKDVITYSDGRVLVGKLFMRGAAQIKMFVPERKTYVSVALSDIDRIKVEVEKATMEKVWRFKEEGSPEKIFTGEEYPLHYYITHITLRNGVTFSSHFTTVFNLKRGSKLTRVFLVTKQRGSTIQNLSDLVYVKSIAFFDRRLAPDGGKLSVSFNGEKEKAVYAVALQWANHQTFNANPKGSMFFWNDLPPDRYDVFVVTDKHIYYSLSRIPLKGSAAADVNGEGLEDLPEKKIDGESHDSGAGLTDEEKESLGEYLEGADEFFDEKRALDYGGNKKNARVLVLQKKVKETSYGTKRKKISLWRYEIWFAHRLQKEWVIDGRSFLWRAYLPEDDQSGVLERITDKRLSGVNLMVKGASVKITIP